MSAISNAETSALRGEIKVRVDDTFQTLSFVSRPSADSFARLCHMYQDESGAGNGYGAYWHFRDQPVVGVDAPRGIGRLDRSRIDQMLGSIITQRLGGKPPELSACDVVTIKESGAFIDFEFNPDRLPPRLSPEPGDLVRIVDNESYRGGIARAGNIEGDIIQLLPCGWGIESEIQVPLAQVMKIPDFMAGKPVQVGPS